jgi:phosphoribosylformylglycinamidine synthase
LNFGNPEKPEIMAQLSAAIDGIAEACTALGTPVTGGNVSLYNETKGEGIYPTPVIGIVGLLEDVSKAVPSGFQREGDIIAVWRPYEPDLDEEKDEIAYERRFGSTDYAKTVYGAVWGTPPGISLELDAKLHAALSRLADEGLVSSMSDISDGGLAVELAKAGFSRGIGAKISLDSFGDHAMALFGETACTVLLSFAPSSLDAIQKIREDAGLGGFGTCGTTGGASLELSYAGTKIVSAPLIELRSAYASTLESQLAAEVVTA